MVDTKAKKFQIQNSIIGATPIELELVWLPKIMERQTDDEIKLKEVKYNNNLGLNGADANIITIIYTDIKEGRHLTNRQVNYLKKVLLKYWRQYAEMQAKGDT